MLTMFYFVAIHFYIVLSYHLFGSKVEVYCLLVVLSVYGWIKVDFGSLSPVSLHCLMLHLQYVPGSHNNHILGHYRRNRLTLTQHRGMGWTNVARRDYQNKFVNSLICHSWTDLLNVP